MNPPLRDKEDQEALLAGLVDGTIDMIATDHAPHSMEEKSKGLAHSLMGVVGLETAFPILYTQLVKPGIITLSKLIDLMSTAPRNRFGLGKGLEIGGPADICVWDLNASSTIDPNEFQTMGRATPFQGMQVSSRCKLTLLKGQIAWEEK